MPVEGVVTSDSTGSSSSSSSSGVSGGAIAGEFSVVMTCLMRYVVCLKDARVEFCKIYGAVLTDDCLP